jgi:hypothetical protein
MCADCVVSTSAVEVGVIAARRSARRSRTIGTSITSTKTVSIGPEQPERQVERDDADVARLRPAPSADHQQPDGRLEDDQQADEEQLVRRDDCTPRVRHPLEVRRVGELGVVPTGREVDDVQECSADDEEHGRRRPLREVQRPRTHSV